MEIDEIIRLMTEAAETILRTVAQVHGTTQATHEAALAEFQGAQILKNSGDPFSHAQSLRETANLLVRNKDRILQLMTQLRQLDPAAASAAQRSLDPVIRVAKDRIGLIQETEMLMNELDLTGN